MNFGKLLPAALVLSTLFGCASSQKAAPPSGTTAPGAAASAPSTGGSRAVKSVDGSFEGEIVGTPAANSKFAKLKIGMRQREVEDLIGPPTDEDGHITGKGFIPFFSAATHSASRRSTRTRGN